MAQPATDRLTAPGKMSTAIHEATHAVASIVLGRRFDRVSIVANTEEGSLGRMTFMLHRRTDAAPKVEPALNRMVIALAGVQAERRLGRRPSRVSWDGDRKVAAWLAFDLAGGDDELTKLYQQVATRRALLLVDGRWDAIERVAAALLDRQTLTRDEAMPLVYPGYRPVAIGA